MLLEIFWGVLHCEHEWKEATCTAPKTCTKCEKTKGTVK